MKAAIVLSFIAAAMASVIERTNGCNADNCARAITGTREGLPPISSRKADCSSFMRATVTPKATYVLTHGLELYVLCDRRMTSSLLTKCKEPPPSPLLFTPILLPSPRTMSTTPPPPSVPQLSQPMPLLATVLSDTPLPALAGASLLPPLPPTRLQRLRLSPLLRTTVSCRWWTERTRSREGCFKNGTFDGVQDSALIEAGN